jgi:hypothetical protein
VKGRKALLTDTQKAATMKITMRVHVLTLPTGSMTPLATLYRIDDVKRTRQQGWTDRITLSDADLQLGDIVTVSIEPAGER